MKKNLMFLALAAIGLASCNGGFKKGNGGMLYDIHVDKGGAKIQEGDFVSLNMIIKTDGDSVLMSTYEQGRPILIMPFPKPQSTGDIINGIKLLAEGDSANETALKITRRAGPRRDAPPRSGRGCACTTGRRRSARRSRAGRRPRPGAGASFRRRCAPGSCARRRAAR